MRLLLDDVFSRIGYAKSGLGWVTSGITGISDENKSPQRDRWPRPERVLSKSCTV